MSQVIRPSDRLVLAGGVAVWLAGLTLMPLTADRSYLGLSGLLIVLLMAVAAIGRRTPWGNTVALPAQLVVFVGFVLVLSRSLTPTVPGLDDSGPFQRIIALLTQATGHMRNQSAPMAADAGVLWLFVAGIGLMAVMTDLLVSGLHRHVWGIAPLLTLYLVPAISLQSDLSILHALAIGVGYLGILLAEGINRSERWRRGVYDDPDHPVRPIGSVLWGSAALIAVPALVLAMIGWLLVPTGSWGLLGGGSGSGNSGPLQLTDPTLDLRRNLNRPDDLTVLTYQTTPDTSGGVYLRMASLPAFDVNGWQNSAMQIVQGQPGPIPGATTESGERRTTTVEIGNFSSEYLPMPYAPRRVDVEGRWGFDPESLVYVSSEESQNDRVRATEGLSYTVESVDITPDGEQLSLASAGNPSDFEVTRPLPDGFPQEIIDLTSEITVDQPTPALKAAAIQSYLRSGEFTYSTEPEPGSGYDALTNFLFQDKRGYCEQFAAAMAAMARAADIPSRVAIGFLPGEEVSPGTFEVSAHDLHAWPELYFEGIGWVQWEPTPGNGASPPPWTVANQGGTGQSEEPQPSASSTAPTVNPTDAPTAPSEQPTSTVDPTQVDTGVGLAPLLISGGALLLLLALASVPGIVRARRRHHRLSGSDPPQVRVEHAWDEVRDTILDHRGQWPTGSPRAVGRQIAHDFDPEQARSMGRLAVMVEQSRFSRTFGRPEQVDGVEQLAGELRGAVIEPTSRWQRVRAAVLPRSLLRPGGRRAG